MEAHAGAMGEQIGPGVMLVELGSGSSTKTRILLDHLEDPVAYVPLDISGDHLLKTADSLRRSYPHLEILPLVADFTQEFELPESIRPRSHAAVYFPGSTIGNFTPREVREALARIAGVIGSQGGLLIGIDLQKDPALIEAAYNDAQRVTDEFNRNLLVRINRELGADFVVERFRPPCLVQPHPRPAPPGRSGADRDAPGEPAGPAGPGGRADVRARRGGGHPQ